MRGYLEDLKAGGRPMTDKELAEHYKHLYSEVKKQKDDVVEYIKKYLHEHIIDDLPDEESKFETENGIPIPNAKEILLRMLGEIENE